jgi:uncharacterized protein (TIGR04255 family)
MRWGILAHEDGDNLTYTFADNEEMQFPEVFAGIMREFGYADPERIAPPLEDYPFAISRRYRPLEGVWPVYQSGLGVISVHQGNEGYLWESYRTAILDGFDRLSHALGDFYPDEVPFIGLELMYADGFHPDEGESPEEFFRNKLRAHLRAPKEFLTSPALKSPTVTSAGFSFEIELATPPGQLIVSVEPVHDLHGRPGYVMETRVRTVRPDISFDKDLVGKWLEEAHLVQQHAFNTLIAPAYQETFR